MIERWRFVARRVANLETLDGIPWIVKGLMTAEDVERIVQEQMRGHWDRWTPHGLDLRRSILSPPIKREFVSLTGSQEEHLELWLVCEEDPDGHSGYQVFFNEESGRFGLAMTTQDPKPAYLGEYGDLWDTLEAM